jgi:hypothetical protein
MSRTWSERVFFLDSNVWIAQAFQHHPCRPVAAAALAQATSQQPAVFCRATQLSFLRLASTPALHRQYYTTGFTNDGA